ncbi:hypothetical protein NL676_032983 [Syzygium grande]|nr:hypothetical protein NL676_032983 [Syzygium grande]
MYDKFDNTRYSGLAIPLSFSFASNFGGRCHGGLSIFWVRSGFGLVTGSGRRCFQRLISGPPLPPPRRRHCFFLNKRRGRAFFLGDRTLVHGQDLWSAFGRTRSFMGFVLSHGSGERYVVSGLVENYAGGGGWGPEKCFEDREEWIMWFGCLWLVGMCGMGSLIVRRSYLWKCAGGVRA